MKTIASRHNPLFKRVRDAIREHAGEIVIEGRKQVDDAIAAGWTPIAVLRRGSDVTDELFDHLAQTKTSQGVIALFERPAPADLFADRSRVIVALDAVQDPGNVGTIVRLAAAFDCGGVAILPGCADPFSPKSIRASVGAILQVPVAPMAAHELIATGWPIYAADASGPHADPPSRQAILLFGSEGTGISPELRSAAKPIGIAMSSRVESLNVAAAAAILLSRSYASRALD